jgi:hypothetical protein
LWGRRFSRRQARQAASNGTQRVVVASGTLEYAFDVDCAAFGGDDFTNQVEGAFTGRLTEVLSGDGALLQTVLQGVFEETDTNSVTGAVLPLRGAIHEVLDYGPNTRTISGAAYIGKAPGPGLYIQDTGRLTHTLDTHETLFVAGPHEGWFGGDDDIVCEALAQA